MSLFTALLPEDTRMKTSYSLPLARMRRTDVQMPRPAGYFLFIAEEKVKCPIRIRTVFRIAKFCRLRTSYGRPFRCIPILLLEPGPIVYRLNLSRRYFTLSPATTKCDFSEWHAGSSVLSIDGIVSGNGGQRGREKVRCGCKLRARVSC